MQADEDDATADDVEEVDDGESGDENEGASGDGADEDDGSDTDNEDKGKGKGKGKAKVKANSKKSKSKGKRKSLEDELMKHYQVIEQGSACNCQCVICLLSCQLAEAIHVRRQCHRTDAEQPHVGTAEG